MGAPHPAAGFSVELSVDGAKAGGGRRALFLPGGSPSRTLTLPVPNGAGARCRTLAVFLRVRPRPAGWVGDTQWVPPLLAQRCVPPPPPTGR